MDELIAALCECAARPDEAVRLVVREYRPPPATAEHNQFLIMLKPELLACDRVDVSAILAIVAAGMAAHGVVAHALAVFSARALVDDRLIEGHYGLLNRVAHTGARALAPRAAAALAEFASEAPVVGAYEFLRQNPDFSARALETLCRNVETVKLGAGVYAITVRCDGRPLVILNPFHPRQLEHFCRPEGAVAVFECRSTVGFARLRREFVGATDPSHAQPGSLKRKLVERAGALGVGPVSIAVNGVHMSPGPVEAMVGLRRWFRRPDGARLLGADTSFGAALRSRGWTEAELDAIEGHLVDMPAGLTPIFEASEDTNGDEALAMLDAREWR